MPPPDVWRPEAGLIVRPTRPGTVRPARTEDASPDGLVQHHRHEREKNGTWVPSVSWMEHLSRSEAFTFYPSKVEGVERWSRLRRCGRSRQSHARSRLRFWELQLVHALRSAGKTLVPRCKLGYTKNKGPDLFAEGEPGAWIEAVVVRRGTGPDALHDHEPMKVYNHNPDGVVLRLRSVILDKSLKLRCVVCRYRG